MIARASEIVHCAATVSFVTGLEDSRRINVEGTRRVLGLAERCARRDVLQRFVHVSTAYVAGTHDGLFGEDDLDVSQRFRNGYERSKFEAEQLVRAHAPLLPAITILRPSIIVGESSTGWTPAFNVLYVPMRAFAHQQMRVLPATRSAPVDVVPADHVADAIIELTRATEPGLHTYHLVAGEDASTVGQLVELSARHLRRRPPPIVPPRLYRVAYPLLVASAGRRRAALKRAAPFLRTTRCESASVAIAPHGDSTQSAFGRRRWETSTAHYSITQSARTGANDRSPATKRPPTTSSPRSSIETRSTAARAIGMDIKRPWLLRWASGTMVPEPTGPCA